ncbi:hypothetical protein BGX38DRAFT_770136 [Terfezia claveryi]|nr:hypothetical protein BGX38DRAFT_770136 [Terfezia claveryi]
MFYDCWLPLPFACPGPLLLRDNVELCQIPGSARDARRYHQRKMNSTRLKPHVIKAGGIQRPGPALALLDSGTLHDRTVAHGYLHTSLPRAPTGTHKQGWARTPLYLLTHQRIKRYHNTSKFDIDGIQPAEQHGTRRTNISYLDIPIPPYLDSTSPPPPSKVS